MDPLTAMHHAGVYQQHLCRLMEVVAGPVLASLRARSAEASLQLDQLQSMKAALVNAQTEGRKEGASYSNSSDTKRPAEVMCMANHPVEG